MPDRPTEHEYARLNPGVSADPPQQTVKPKPAREKNDAALAGSGRVFARGSVASTDAWRAC